MVDRQGRIITASVYVAYACLIGVVLIFVARPWNLLLAVLVAAKAALYYTVVRRANRIGAKQHASRPDPVDSRPHPSEQV